MIPAFFIYILFLALNIAKCNIVSLMKGLLAGTIVPFCNDLHSLCIPVIDFYGVTPDFGVKVSDMIQ